MVNTFAVNKHAYLFRTAYREEPRLRLLLHRKQTTLLSSLRPNGRPVAGYTCVG